MFNYLGVIRFVKRLLDKGDIMNMYKDEIIKTLEQEVVELREKITFFKDRVDYNQMQMRECQSQLAEAVVVLKQLRGGVY